MVPASKLDLCTHLLVHRDLVDQTWVSVTKVSGRTATHVTCIVGPCGSLRMYIKTVTNTKP